MTRRRRGAPPLRDASGAGRYVEHALARPQLAAANQLVVHFAEREHARAAGRPRSRCFSSTSNALDGLRPTRQTDAPEHTSGMADLFSDAAASGRPRSRRLRRAMRPRTLDEFVGQQHVLGPSSSRSGARSRPTGSRSFDPLRPAGHREDDARPDRRRRRPRHFVGLSACRRAWPTSAKIIERGRSASARNGQRTILLIDEIHRFNKAQQDALLHAVEQGVVTLIGATTENP